jgi:RNA polymerase sigma factor (TIGR02999 family)
MNTSTKSQEHSKMIEDVYHELRLYAHNLINKEFGALTFQATELANETYLKLFQSDNIDWSDRRQFLSAAVVVMRRYLVDHARKKAAIKRIPKNLQKSIDDVINVSESINEQIISLDEALSNLEKLDPKQAKIVELRFFAGLTESEVADLLKISRSTVSREWKISKIWLRSQMQK